MPIEVYHQSFHRTARVLVPVGWKEDWAAHGRRPVIVLLHDEDRNTPGRSFAAFAEFKALVHGGADQDLSRGRFVVVVADGIEPGFDVNSPNDRYPYYDGLASWASGHRGRDAIALSIDDVGFLDQLLTKLDDTMTADLAVPGARALDLEKICVAGLGNGAEMAFRLATAFNAVAPSAAQPSPPRVHALAAVAGSHFGYPHDPSLPPLGFFLYMQPYVPTAPPGMNAVPPRLLAIGFGPKDRDFIVEETPPDAMTPSRAKELILLGSGVATDYAPWSRTLRYSLEQWVTGWAAAPGASVQVEEDGVLLTRTEWLDPGGVRLYARLLEDPFWLHDWPRTSHPGGWSAARVIWNFFVEVYDR